MVEEEISKNDEDQIRNFMKVVHMEISTKLKLLSDDRQQMEERVISVLERVIATCLS